ncbi:hypothetical protein LCGC14_0911040 [marine sediment metagenome]|uniref:Uncharacterized protein n=1 Tax=marine sediment metagenome TaxID=412755 RepID=A0A0F9S0H7_9ZZZZ|nr:hypothetical protein [Candidatus Aminicenantes bacterium]
MRIHRWKKNPYKTYGRSPSVDVISELKILQEQEKHALLHPFPIVLTKWQRIKRSIKRLVKLED